MALVLDGPVSATALTTFVRNVPADPSLALTGLFPTRLLDNNTIDFAEVVRTNRTARFRSFDGRIHVSERDIGTEKRVRLLPLSSSIGVGEYERLQLEFARTGGTNSAVLARAIYNDGERLTREVQARMEQAWGDVLLDGRLTINENGYQGEADFGIPANHLVTAATPWTTTGTAPALDDLTAWVDIYVATNGFRPGSMVGSLRAQRLFLRNAQVVAAVGNGRSRATLAEANDLLIGEGLPVLRDTYDGLVDVDGVTTRVLPDDRMVLLPPDVSALGYTAYGLTATALELLNAAVVDLSFSDAPGIVGVIEKVGPPYRQMTYVDAVGMPILEKPRQLFVADVA